MNILPLETQAQIIGVLVEGMSIRGAERQIGVARNTIMRLGVKVGEACARLHDLRMRGLNVAVLEADEIWSFIGKKEKRVTEEDDPSKGDCYTWIAMDATRKAIISYRVGKRDDKHARAFIADLRLRILNRPQLTTDGYSPYIPAVLKAFGEGIDYAMLVKQYGPGNPEEGADRRYSPSRVTGSRKRVVTGKPEQALISTSFVERQNLTVRMHTRRFTRLTNAFSKVIRNHTAAVGLYVAWYNFCRVHESLRITPAMEIGLTDHVWSIAELIQVSGAIPWEEPDLDEPGSADLEPRTVPDTDSEEEALEAIGLPTRVPWLRVIGGGSSR